MEKRALKFRQWVNDRFYFWGIGVDENTFAGPASGGGINAENTVHHQFTGIYDKNGKPIYEGDVVRVEWQHDGMTNYDYEIVGVVKYEVDRAQFGVDNEAKEQWCPFYSCEREELLEDGLEVIGNVMENPELLEARHD